MNDYIVEAKQLIEILIEKGSLKESPKRKGFYGMLSNFGILISKGEWINLLAEAIEAYRNKGELIIFT